MLSSMPPIAVINSRDTSSFRADGSFSVASPRNLMRFARCRSSSGSQELPGSPEQAVWVGSVDRVVPAIEVQALRKIKVRCSNVERIDLSKPAKLSVISAITA